MSNSDNAQYSAAQCYTVLPTGQVAQTMRSSLWACFAAWCLHPRTIIHDYPMHTKARQSLKEIGEWEGGQLINTTFSQKESVSVLNILCVCVCVLEGDSVEILIGGCWMVAHFNSLHISQIRLPSGDSWHFLIFGIITNYWDNFHPGFGPTIHLIFLLEQCEECRKFWLVKMGFPSTHTERKKTWKT